MSFSDTLEAAILNHVFGGGDYARPATLYLAIYTAAPSDAGGGTEATGGGYARLSITNNGTNFPAATGTAPTEKDNGVDFDFPAATGAAWSAGANMTHWALHTNVSTDTPVVWGALEVAKPVLESDVLRVPAGSMTITLD